MKKRILAFISDIHSNLPALRAVLDDINNHEISFDDVYCLGDLVGYGTRPNEVISLIKKFNVKTILGNYDEAVGFYLPTCGCNINSSVDRLRSANSLSWTSEHTTEKSKEFLRSLDEELSLNESGYNILLAHGSPSSINDYVFEADEEKMFEISDEVDYDVILLGHTHFPYFKKFGDKIFINPGSVGRPKDGDNRACYTLVTFDADSVDVEFIRVSYDIKTATEEIYNSNLLDIFGDILIYGKDIR